MKICQSGKAHHLSIFDYFRKNALKRRAFFRIVWKCKQKAFQTFNWCSTTGRPGVCGGISMEEFKRLKRELIAKGHIIDYYHDTMQIPNGNIAVWDFIEHKGAAAVVAVRDDGKLFMVRQYRNALERETLEIPAGGLDGREEPTEKAAMRELEEETGYKCDKLEFLISIRTTVAFCNEKIDIYVARNLIQGKQHLDENEFIKVEAYTVDELMEMIYAGQIQDSKTICAIMTYAKKYGC